MNEITYPYYAIEEGDLDIICCGPMRYRLFYKTKLVRTFKFFTQAVNYMDKEFTL